MDVFKLRDSVIGDYQRFIEGFLHIRDERICQVVKDTLDDGMLWPEPWFSLNPKFAPGGTVEDLVRADDLHPGCTPCSRWVRRGARHSALVVPPPGGGDRRRPGGDNYVLTTGTGSGKSLTYIIPIVDRCPTGGPGAKASRRSSSTR